MTMSLKIEDCRPEVKAFAIAMEEKLRDNDHKGGWEDMDPQSVLTRLCDEMAELFASFNVERTNRPNRVGPREAFVVAEHAMMHAATVLRRYPGTMFTRGNAKALSPEEAMYSRSLNGVLSETADVANFAMMLADVCGALKTKQGESQ